MSVLRLASAPKLLGMPQLSTFDSRTRLSIRVWLTEGLRRLGSGARHLEEPAHDAADDPATWGTGAELERQRDLGRGQATGGRLRIRAGRRGAARPCPASASRSKVRRLRWSQPVDQAIDIDHRMSSTRSSRSAASATISGLAGGRDRRRCRGRRWWHCRSPAAGSRSSCAGKRRRHDPPEEP